MNNRSSNGPSFVLAVLLLAVHPMVEGSAFKYYKMNVDSTDQTVHPWRLAAVGGSTLTAFAIGRNSHRSRSLTFVSDIYRSA